MKRLSGITSIAAVLLTGCAAKPVVVAVAPPPIAAPAPVAAPLPKGAFPGMVIPAALPDGSYPTPNRALTPAATVWHLRAALNVAALACRGPQEGAIIAGYNAMLAARKPELARVEARYAAEFRSAGADWQDRYDDAMTRLYNFFSQSPARDEFCAAAAAILADGAGVPAEGLDAFAAARLPMLDRPFTDFYRAYDAWRGNAVRPLAQQSAVYAANATVALGPVAVADPAPVSVPAPVRANVPGVVAVSTPVRPVARIPWLVVDPSVLR